MKINNETAYDTRFLRRVLVRVHQLVAKDEGRLPTWSRLVVEVKYASRSHGYAYYHGCLARLYLTRSPETATKRQRLTTWAPVRQDTRRLVDIFWHELMHLYGYGHKGGHIGRAPRGRMSRHYPDAAFVDEAMRGLPDAVPDRERKPAPKRDVRAERYERLLKRRKAWEAKLRRAQTALKNLKPKIRYYERTLERAASVNNEKGEAK